MDPAQALKQQAAGQVLAYIQSGMIVGLGAGSTAILAVRGLAEKLSRGELSDIQGIPCSRVIEAEARSLGIPLTSLEDHPVIDLTFDGADEVDPVLNLIKGGGAGHALGGARRGHPLRLADPVRLPGESRGTARVASRPRRRSVCHRPRQLHSGQRLRPYRGPRQPWRPSGCPNRHCVPRAVPGAGE
jgi:hypothetical protein